MKKLFRLPVILVLLVLVGGVISTGCATTPPQLQPAEPDAVESPDEDDGEKEDGIGS